MDPTQPQNLDDYSQTRTTIEFPHPLPLLRVPIPSTDQSPVLAFKSPHSWASAYASSVSQLTRQCDEGYRIGCALRASNNCKPPWWRNLIGRRDLREREECEEREMEGCMVVAREKCVGFARDKCRRPFLEARVAVGERVWVRDLICLGSVPEGRGWGLARGLILLGERRFLGSSLRARELFGCDADYESYVKGRR